MVIAMMLHPVYVAFFQAWCAVMVFLSSWSTDCHNQLTNSSRALNTFDLIEIGSRDNSDSLLYAMVAEALLIAAFNTRTTDNEFDVYNRNTYIKASLLFILAFVRVRRAGFFGVCLEEDGMCCSNCESSRNRIFRIDSTTCNTPNSIPHADCYEHRSWADARNYCAVPAYFFDCREQNNAIKLHRFPDHSHCYNWGCDADVSPLRAWMTPVSTVVVIISLYLF